MRVAICTMIKNENLYLRDWVQYYKSVGVDNILLYDNNNINGEKVFTVIGDYIDDGFVKYKDMRNLKYDNVGVDDIEKLKTAYYENDVEQLKKKFSILIIQLKVFQEAFDTYKSDYDWIGFFDIDEYLTLKKDNTVQQYLSRFPHADLIYLNWLHYSDNDQLHYEPKPLYERFPNYIQPLDFQCDTFYCNMLGKSFVHCKPENYDSKFETTIHFMTIKNENPLYINNVGQRVYLRENQAFLLILYNYDLAYIKHFMTKSCYEYFYMKTDFLQNKPDDSIIYDIKKFFSYNKVTREKCEVVKKYLKRIGKEHLIEQMNKEISQR